MIQKTQPSPTHVVAVTEGAGREMSIKNVHKHNDGKLPSCVKANLGTTEAPLLLTASL